MKRREGTGRVWPESSCRFSLSPPPSPHRLSGGDDRWREPAGGSPFSLLHAHFGHSGVRQSRSPHIHTYTLVIARKLRLRSLPIPCGRRFTETIGTLRSHWLRAGARTRRGTIGGDRIDDRVGAQRPPTELHRAFRMWTVGARS